jgi:AraC family transcriptional regulator
LVAEVSDRWLEHVRDYAAVPREPICVGNAELSWLAMRLYREYSLGGFASPLAIEGMMLEIAAGLLRKEDRNSHLRGAIWLSRACDILHARFHEPLGLSSLASRVGVHPVHLAREFRRHYGCTVGQYVRRLRVDSASRMLVESESSLVAIALEVGFANQAHFCRIFKLLTGISPARYRSCSTGVSSRHNVSIRKGTSAA